MRKGRPAAASAWTLASGAARQANVDPHAEQYISFTFSPPFPSPLSLCHHHRHSIERPVRGGVRLAALPAPGSLRCPRPASAKTSLVVAVRR